MLTSTAIENDTLAPLSKQILARLGQQADQLARPHLRHATLDRLVVACDAISDGSARATVQRGNPSAFPHFRQVYTPVSPPRIEDYIVARRTIDQTSKRSVWTGPMASTLRKEGDGMLAYVRAREQERRAQLPASASERQVAWWTLVDSISDDVVRAKLLRELSEGRHAILAVKALKAAMRAWSPSFDIDSYLRGGEPAITSRLVALPTPLNHDPDPKHLVIALAKRLTNNARLAAFDLEYDGSRIRQVATKEPLVEAAELAALHDLLGLN